MPFVLRVTDEPPLNQQLELEQIIIIDKTGPAIATGPSPGASCLVGEFLKGPFIPTEVTSPAELVSIFGTLSSILSQNVIGAAAVQDGSGNFFNGNGMLQLKNKTFNRLIIQRVDTDAVTTDGGTTKATVAIVVTFDASDLSSGVTNKDILIPAGTLFADQALSTATVVMAMSQDITIPKGTSGPTFTINPTVMLIKGTTAGIGVIDTVISSAIPNVLSTLTSVNNSTTLFPPGTGANLKARIESVYPTAITKTLPMESPQEDIVFIWSARRASTIRQALAANVVSSSVQGRGRMTAVAADPAESSSPTDANTAKTAAKALATTEGYRTVGAGGDRVVVCFPHSQIFSTELGSRNVTVSPDGWMGVAFATHPEEENPAAETPAMQFIQGLEDAFQQNPMSRQDYVDFRANGVCALIKDRTAGWWFQSGVTAVNPTNDPTRRNIFRRRMADFIQDGLADIVAPFDKKPATEIRKDAMVGGMHAFLELLKSPDQPANQRIVDYLIDENAANTPAAQALGIEAVLVQVQLLPSMDVIKLVTQIGETVTISEVP